MGLVGESGCGKSVTALAIMGLLPKGAAEVSGRIRFDRIDLLGLSDREMRDLRGDRLAMIFQEPMTSLNPSLLDRRADRRDSRPPSRPVTAAGARARHRAVAAGENPIARRSASTTIRTGFPAACASGRMIALALACDPQLLIADEPTTALDVTIQAQILDLMRDLKAATGAAIILITHDLGVVAELCDEVAVMYAGEIVERAPVDALFASTAASLYGRPPWLDPAARFERRRARRHRRHGAEHGRAAAGMPLRPALSIRCARFARKLRRRSLPIGPSHEFALLARPVGAGAVMSAPLLEVEGLGRHFVVRRSVLRPSDRGTVTAVDGVSFSLEAGETLRLVGESGCGKSTLGRLVLRLIDPTAGRIHFDGRDVTALEERRAAAACAAARSSSSRTPMPRSTRA